MLYWFDNLLSCTQYNAEVVMLLVHLSGSHYKEMCLIAVENKFFVTHVA